jgi:hypothetical protein
MVRTICCIEKGFCSGRNKAGAVQNNVAQLIAQIRAAWLPRHNDGVTFVGQPFLKKTNLRGLARAITALEGDEYAGH